MAEYSGVWGIDIGQAGLKAMRLEKSDEAGVVRATAFDYVPHPKILSQPDAIPDDLIRQALDTFLSRNEVKEDRVCISVPGQSALTRFIQLPPVESNKVAEIVKYEARQQIPFALEDVCWDWQTLGSGSEESGYMLEAEVGLFAMKKDQVAQHLQPFTDRGVEVDLIQIAPVALYNYLNYDRLGYRPDQDNVDQDEYTIVLDMGADNTTLMVSNGVKVWIRNVPLGGNHFTRALTKEMKLTFAKAEHLKINATKAPDPRSVFQALRPVFNDYVAEIQRSIGYFSSVNRNAKITRVLGMGNGFKLAGLQKFLQQNLQYEVERVDEFPGLVGDSVLNAGLFVENRLSFAVPYGLALQGLELTRIHVDLLPQNIRTQRMIRQKKPFAVLTAAVLLFAMALSATLYARMSNSVNNEAWDKSKKIASDVTSKTSTEKTAYDGKVAEFKSQTEKDLQLIRSDQGRTDWLEVRKAITVAVPRDPPDKFPENEIAKRNRLRIWSISAKKYNDLSGWLPAVKAANPGVEGFLRPEDQSNPPSGPGYVITLGIVHYHELKDPKSGEIIPNESGAVWVRRTLIENLKKWRVSQQFPQPTGAVPVREIGITHPLIILEGRPERFMYVLDRRKMAAGKVQGAAQPGIGGVQAPMVGGVNVPGLGGIGGIGQQPKSPAVPAAPGQVQTPNDGSSIEIPITRCTVQFVWRPVPFYKRAVMNLLYEFFKNNPTGDFQAAKAFVDNRRKQIEATNAQVSSAAERILPPSQLTQDLFDEYVRMNRTKEIKKAAPKAQPQGNAPDGAAPMP